MGLVVGLAASASGCAPMVESAPFSVRPDSIERGDLLGPFDGLVVDDENGRPLGGAVVYASWAFERGVGLVGPAGARDVAVTTESDGRYRIPRLEALPDGLSTRVRRFTMVVYRRGYVGWRSDSVFPGGSRRFDFSQRANRVRLPKWRAGLAHHRHLAFLGGGVAVRDAAAWELQPAALELEGGVATARTAEGAGRPAGEAGPVALLDVSSVLSEDELRAVTGYAGGFEVTRLDDRPRTEFYDTRHFKAQGQPETFDVVVRVWRLGGAAAEEQYRRILADLPNATRAEAVGDAAVRTDAPAARALAFLLRSQGTVVSVTCGSKQCTDPGMLDRLAKLVESRVAELPAPAPAQGEGTQAPAPPAAEPTP